MNWLPLFTLLGVVIALGVALLALARWARRKNARLPFARKRAVKGKLTAILLPSEVDSWEDLFFGNMSKSYSDFGRVGIFLGIGGAIAIVAIAIYAILKAK